jgi:hypothetical protein
MHILLQNVHLIKYYLLQSKLMVHHIHMHAFGYIHSHVNCEDGDIYVKLMDEKNKTSFMKLKI